MRFLRQLFGSDTRGDTSTKEQSKPTGEHTARSSGQRISDQYFDTMLQMRAAISKNDFEEAARLIRLNLQYIPGWVKETFREYGAFEIPSIPALQQGGRILALVGDDKGLNQMREIVTSSGELDAWTENIEEHQRDRHLFRAILEAIGQNPNCLQTEVKELIGEQDGRRVATLISYLERAGKLVRNRKGRTYELAIGASQSEPAPSQPNKRAIGSHRTDRCPPDLREIDIASLSYVPLPRAPLKWEETEKDHERAKVPDPEGYFEIQDSDWRVESIESIPLAERPDPAFRQIYPSGSGLLMVDDLGKAEGLGCVGAAALRYDRTGNLVAKVGLQHGTYRIGVHPLGHGMIAMSRDCVIHAYDNRLSLMLETAMTGAPEILALRKRFDISEDKLKNHIRCVALSAEARSYLFTAVDEAWCIGMDGKALWGAKLPVKEGWTRVANPASNFRTSAEVEHALEVMGLSLPIDPDKVKHRYRSLAKEWHPDLNPNMDQAEEKMKELNLAAEALTGIEASSLPRYAGAAFSREGSSMEFEIDGHKVEMTMSFTAGEINVSDWIYAACFAAKSDSVYLAGYSGRVVHVDQYGRGVRAYDIGSVPRRIIDTGDYLYFLTDTRLYVLRGDALVALIDTFEAGDLIVAQAGFGLLQKKHLRWYREDGQCQGSVVSKDPIRRVYSADNRMIVETRQRRAVMSGVPAFWE